MFPLMIIGVTTLIILVSSILRSIICFQGRMMYFTSPVGSPAVMYVFWGALEFGVNLLYIIGRVDLRFYRPDRLPKDVRNVVTAEQSLYPSEIEDEGEDQEVLDKESWIKFLNHIQEKNLPLIIITMIMVLVLVSLIQMRKITTPTMMVIKITMDLILLMALQKT